MVRAGKEETVRLWMPAHPLERVGIFPLAWLPIPPSWRWHGRRQDSCGAPPRPHSDRSCNSVDTPGPRPDRASWWSAGARVDLPSWRRLSCHRRARPNKAATGPTIMAPAWNSIKTFSCDANVTWWSAVACEVCYNNSLRANALLIVPAPLGRLFYARHYF